MALLASIRSATRSAPQHDRSVLGATPPHTGPAEAEAPLPRHVLVALAAIAAEVTSLRQRSVDDPQLHGTLDVILGRLDGLVDSIYERAAERGRTLDASSRQGAALTADPPATVVVLPVGNRRAPR